MLSMMLTQAFARNRRYERMPKVAGLKVTKSINICLLRMATSWCIKCQSDWIERLHTFLISIIIQ